MQYQVITSMCQAMFYNLEIPLQRDNHSVFLFTVGHTAQHCRAANARHGIKMLGGGVQATTLIWVVREDLFEEDTFKFNPLL